ncbi:SpoIIE family protein phosphatase [Janthinobacterium sp. PC23-8]|uniref:SpoIIE family protein phosphatase n=1 Tax=Janthinobacterium sp. PC23-8 TaxID=2012679 RepID=UPI000B97BB57|nr:SpoIIE family protein phosphatase [Janthinobacterium sp. PC23-8]OYO27921.1 serine/threonine protein phosphatase [Janthinobacterium sp. PC23-8]
MSDLSATLFARYNWVMRATFIGVVLIACVLVYRRFEYTLSAHSATLAGQMQEQASALDAIMKSSADGVNTMRQHAQTWYRLHPQAPAPSPLLQALQDCREHAGICLDTPPPPWRTSDIGNLTGVPGPLTPALRRDLEMALSLNDSFRSIGNRVQEAAWVYYISQLRFINLYPWVSSKKYFYADSLMQKAFFRDVRHARDEAQPVAWTSAYLDDAGQGAMVTASAGVFDNGQFQGVVAVDVTLERLNTFVRNWRANAGTLFIINTHGQLLAHPSLVQPQAPQILPRETAFPPAIARDLPATLLASRGHLVLAHGYYMETIGISNAPFQLVLLVPQHELIMLSLETGVLIVLLLVIGLTVMLVVANRLTYLDAVLPAQKLVRYIQLESSGPGQPMPVVPTAWLPWFHSIRAAFNAHTQLVSIQQELDVARRMQQSIVPKIFPVRAELQMFGLMIAAMEVGGDFYDYFWLSETRIGVVIADVSGKGVPAALFMAVSRTLLRAIAAAASGPGECLARANNLLVQENEQNMFITLFYGILDTRSGQLVYANGGHTLPFLIHSNATVTTLEGTGGMALGVMEDIVYAEKTVFLAPDTTLLLYTDGITEAFNPFDQAFGEQRLAEQLVQSATLKTEPLLTELVACVQTFAAGAPQSDDITCLAMRYVSAQDA